MVNFEDGTLVKGAYVVIDGAEYPVVMPEYSGNTPTSAENLNKMQEDLQKEIDKLKIITNGTRNKVYLIGKQNASPTGASTSGQLALFVSNLGDYNESVPAFFAINKDGEVERTVLATVPSSAKKVYVYTDDEYDYIFLYAPNYHDNFFVDVLVNYNVTLDLQEMTVDEFNTYITSMTKVAEV